MKSRIPPKSATPSMPFEAEGSAGLPNLPNLPFSGLGNQSNANSESTKSIVFRLGINKTHPKWLDCQLFGYFRYFDYFGFCRSPQDRAKLSVH